MVCKHITHFSNSETFPRSYDSKHNIYRVYTTTFMFIDLSKTIFFFFFFLSSLTVHLPAYCHSISVCLVITWEICVSVSIDNCCSHQVQTWHSWVFGYELKDLGYATNAGVLGCNPLKKQKQKNTAYSEGGDSMRRMCADCLKDLLEQTMDWQQGSPWRARSVKRIKGQK